MADADSWDAENFEADEPAAKATGLDKWEGEDEDEEIKDNWDDEEEVKQVKEKKPVKLEVPEKKKLIAKIKEREKKEQEDNATIAKEKLTPEEQAADQLRAKQLQEAADLELANDAFGKAQEQEVRSVVSDEFGVPNNVPVVSAAVTGIDTLSPSSKDDFTELQKLLIEKISSYESSVHYSSFLESLFRDLCISLEVEDLKKISNSLTVLLSEKQKQEKQNKAKKKKKGVLPAGGLKAKLKDDLDDYGEFEGGYTQDYEDFM